MESTNSKNIFTNAVIFFLIVCCCFSCKKHGQDDLRILIQNLTEDSIHVRLFPKEVIDGSYSVCEGCGSWRNTRFSLAPNHVKSHWRREIFLTTDLNIKPYELALKAFDSIYIRTAYNLIIFTHESVTGYTENIFSEDSTWDFEIYEDDLLKSSYKYYIENRYTFRILKDKIIISNQ